MILSIPKKKRQHLTLATNCKVIVQKYSFEELGYCMEALSNFKEEVDVSQMDHGPVSHLSRELCFNEPGFHGETIWVQG